MAKQRDGEGKNMQKVGVIKGGNEHVLTGARSVIGQWREYIEELLKKRNESSMLEWSKTYMRAARHM